MPQVPEAMTAGNVKVDKKKRKELKRKIEKIFRAKKN
jgi:hypothetical protein